MKKNQNNKLAFSLIELSVVILIIGILILGIAKGSNFIKESKIRTAQSLTISSPVASMSGLTLWLESTLDKSFPDGDAVDTALGATGTIDTWNDINPHTTSPKNATQTTAASNPRYFENGINGLPSVNFDRVNDFLVLGNASSLGISNSDYEMFFVYQSNFSNTGNNQFIIGGPAGAYNLDINGTPLRIRYTPTNAGPSFTDTSHSNDFTAHMVTVRVQNNIVYVRADGGNDVSRSNIDMRSAETGEVRLGVRTDDILPFGGEISEVIIFNRFLKLSERQAIEKYLSTKWNIPI